VALGSTAFRRSPRGVITRATRVRAQSNEKIKPSEPWDRRIAYVELAVSQDGVLIEYLTVPVVELTRNSKSEGENGPPGGPEKVTLLGGVTINDG
jgi:hypothetical protein